MSRPDPLRLYKVLGVEKNATNSEIKKACRRCLLEQHPDKGGTEEGMAKVAEAKENLLDPDLRKEYDKNGTTSAFITTLARTAFRCSPLYAVNSAQRRRGRA